MTVAPARVAPAPLGRITGDPMRPLPFAVRARRSESPATVSIEVEPVGDAIDRPAPGQFVMVWAFGVGEVPISVSHVDGHRITLTIRSVGAVSEALVSHGVGEVLGVRGPFGTAWPVDAAAGRDVVVVAGGLGLAPLRMAIDELVAGGRPARHVTLVVGARSPDQVLYPAAMDAWAEAGASVHPTVDTAGRSWHGAVGTATAQLERLAERHELAFVCGPELMMTSAARSTVALGTPADQVWVSLERNMHCGVAQCGRCQLGPLLLCRDGAVVRWSDAATLLEVRGR
jgi:anaerobic sulfite reductase subunit B